VSQYIPNTWKKRTLNQEFYNKQKDPLGVEGKPRHSQLKENQEKMAPADQGKRNG